MRDKLTLSVPRLVHMLCLGILLLTGSPVKREAAHASEAVASARWIWAYRDEPSPKKDKEKSEDK